MILAWQFVKRNNMTMSDALKLAWRNIKLYVNMKSRIVKFIYTKLDGTQREASGTMDFSVIPAIKGTGRKSNDTIQVYYDTDKQEYRSFKKANLIAFA